MSSVAIARRLSLWLTCVVAAFGCAAAFAQSEESDPPGRVARLSLIDGEVSFAPAGTDEWAEAVLNRPITSEDRVWVGVDGRAELQVGSATVHLDRETQFGFVQLDDDVMQMSLVDGAATIRIRRLAESETIKIETPNATVHLREVGEYHLEVDPDSDQTIVKTRSGEAEVSGGGSRYTVRTDERGVFSGLETLSGNMEALAPRTPFEAWANDRERRHQETESARYVSRDVVGHEDLDDHGEWVHEREYGHVWRPRHVVHDWAPYRFGRWSWVSPWGWTWIDDAPWGFAPFHYGRWVHVRHRWCWVPGPRHLRPVYAPALVGWLGGPSVSVSVSFGSVGWYPLGPHEVYLPGYRHTPRYIRHVNVSNTIIVNNTHITNVYGRRARYQDDHRYRRHVHAVTAVQRDQFVGGRPLGGRHVRLNDGELRQWRGDSRPPAIAPYRESVLAAAPRTRRHDVSARGQEDRWVSGRTGGRRVDFTAERRAIEENGGRPIGRSQLLDGPKSRGDFRSTRSASIDRDKRDRVARQQVEPQRAVPRAGESERSRDASALPRNSSELRRETQRGEDVWRNGGSRRNERVESLRADETRAERERRSESTPRMDVGQEERRARTYVQPQRREQQVRPREREARDVQRSYGNAFRSRESSPPAQRLSAPPEQRSAAPAAEQRSRSHEASPRKESRSSRGGERSEGSARHHGSPRRSER
jgi:hypothetical protein